MLRILWYSTIPYSSVGYGNATREILRRFRKDGHYVKIATKHALGGQVEVDGVECFDGEVGLINIIRQEENYDYIISMCDDWVFPPDFKFDKWVNCCFLDTHTMHTRMLNNCNKAMHTIAVTKFTQHELDINGRKSWYAPLGVSTSSFKPDINKRKAFRESRGWTENMFAIGTVGLNYGTDRKNFLGLLRAFKLFHAKHPDSILYLHTDVMGTTTNGLPLMWAIESMGFKNDGTGPIQYVLQKPYHLWALSEEAMVQTYNAFDVFVLPTHGEGFGMPIVEAQACFPKGTKISAENIYKTHINNYTGELIEITTKDKKIEVTPEHPFWTGNGWTLAKDLDTGLPLWYNNTIINKEVRHASKGISEIWTGDINRVIRSIQNNDFERSFQESRNSVWDGPMANISIKSKEDTITKTSLKTPVIIRSRMGLFGRINRWGWHNYNKKTIGERQQLEASYRSMQYFIRSNRLVERENKSSQYSCRSKAYERGFWKILYVLDNRNIFSSFISKIRKAFDYKKESLPYNINLVRRKIKSESSRKDFKETGNSYPTYENFKPETILSIRRRQVKDFPVYNLSTLNGMYVAEGFLVHNCGIPVITTDTTSGKELTKSGWLIDVEESDLEFSTHLTWYAKIQANKIVAKLEEAYDAWKSGKIKEMGIKAREEIICYDWDIVYRDYWKPIFDYLDLEKQGKKFEVPLYPNYKALYDGFGQLYQIGNCENFEHHKTCLDMKMPRLPNEPEDDTRPLLIRSYPLFPDASGELYVHTKCPVHKFMPPRFVKQCTRIWGEVLTYPIVRKELQKLWEEKVKDNAEYVKLSEITTVFDEDYSAFLQKFFHTTFKIGPVIGELIKDNTSFVDIGCGDGFILKQLKYLFPTANIKGTEINPTWIDDASVVYGDVTKLPFADGEFEVAFSVDVLEHIPDIRKALSELFRVAKKKLVLCVTPLDDLCFEEDPTHVVKWTGEQWKRELNELGNIVAIGPDNTMCTFVIEKRGG